MRLILLALVLCGSVARAEEPRVLAKDLTDNRKVQLLAVQISLNRGQNLEAKFVDLDSKARDVFVVQFPSHSHTTHEATLSTIIRSCVDWREPENQHAWRDTKMDAVFSVPKDAVGYHGRSNHYDRWFLISLKPPSAD